MIKNIHKLFHNFFYFFTIFLPKRGFFKNVKKCTKNAKTKGAYFQLPQPGAQNVHNLPVTGLILRPIMLQTTTNKLVSAEVFPPLKCCPVRGASPLAGGFPRTPFIPSGLILRPSQLSSRVNNGQMMAHSSPTIWPLLTCFSSKSWFLLVVLRLFLFLIISSQKK